MRQSGARSLAQERIGWCLIAVLSCLPAGAPRGRQSSWLGSCSGSRVSDRADRPRRVEPGDPLSPTPSTAAATAVMRGNKGRDTAPELALRSVLHRRGMRFRKRFGIRLGPRVLGQPCQKHPSTNAASFARVNTASGCVQRRRRTRATGRRSSPATSLGTATPIAGWLRWAGRFCGLGSTRIRMPSQIASSGRCMNALRRTSHRADSRFLQAQARLPSNTTACRSPSLSWIGCVARWPSTNSSYSRCFAGTELA